MDRAVSCRDCEELGGIYRRHHHQHGSHATSFVISVKIHLAKRIERDAYGCNSAGTAGWISPFASLLASCFLDYLVL